MSLATQCYLLFAVVWFGTKGLDALFGYPNPTFNAALALAGMIACVANRIEAVAPKPPGAT